MLRPLSPGEARIDDGFWAQWQRLNRDVLIPAGRRELERAGNFSNLRAAAAGSGEYRGFVFQDSDLHKWLEAVGHELARAPSAELERMADETTALLEAAQDEDGYLNSCYQVEGRERWSNLAWDHELYCAGHLFEAAVAQPGNVRLLGVARRLADHLVDVFMDGSGCCGHPEVELALVALYRLTGSRAYLELAGRFVDRRGHGTLQPAYRGAAYFQDRVPVRAQSEVEGHAVRALYLACGAADLYLETGEPALLEALRAQWHDMAARKAYVTGGVGGNPADEAFGGPYELPADRAYAETCAAIASVFFNWRMLLATGEPRFAELLERTLYNGVLAGVALDGSGFAYVNPLHVRDSGFVRFYPWFPCACCPPNLMRLLASLQRYVATRDERGVQIHQYMSGTFGGVRVRTDYPWDGRVEVEAPGTVSLRVPAGARLDGEPVAPGYVTFSGRRAVLELDMAPRVVAAHPRVDAVRGCIAIERGPLVYCIEAAEVDDLRLFGNLRAVSRPDLLGGIVAVEADGVHEPAGDPDWPYAPPAACPGRPVPLLAVPYAFWGNRGPGAMRVWIPQSS
ncbi:MAG TPA: beta-L-arabinofuranosidase domain-containing protein [Solirubrobacter sp.]|nr:beta-L-arabinofuranosidase domain-containing protein [Solirubrobacter sp.]